MAKDISKTQDVCVSIIVNHLKSIGWWKRSDDEAAKGEVLLFLECLKGKTDEKVLSLLCDDLGDNFYKFWIANILEKRKQIGTVELYRKMAKDLDSAISQMRTLVRNEYVKLQLDKITSVKKMFKSNPRLYLHEKAMCNECNNFKIVHSDKHFDEFRVMVVKRVFWCDHCNQERKVKLPLAKLED